MGRQKEKQYQSQSEYRLNSRSRKSVATSTEYHNLPFDCCALTLTPYTSPVCFRNGIIFEASAIIPYLLKYKKDPVTGNSCSSKELVTLNMERNENGKWQCPVLCKPFSDNIKIAAICQAPENVANVYSFEAVQVSGSKLQQFKHMLISPLDHHLKFCLSFRMQELNFKRKCYEDLISGKKFHRTRDVIIISDKNDPARNINNFKHMTTLREEKQASLLASKGNENESHIRHSVTAARIMKKIKHKREEEEIEKSKKMKLGQVDSTMDGCSVDKGVKIFTDDITGVRMTSGKTSGSFTSTAMSVSNDNETREATKDEILESQFNAMKKLKKKGTSNYSHQIFTIVK